MMTLLHKWPEGSVEVNEPVIHLDLNRTVEPTPWTGNRQAVDGRQFDALENTLTDELRALWTLDRLKRNWFRVA